MGLHRASLYAPAAFIASVVFTQDLVGAMLGLSSPFSFHFDSTLKTLAQSIGRNEWRSLGDFDFTVSQRSLFEIIDNACFEDLLRSAPDSRFRALALSSSIPHSGDWLRVIPSPQLGLHFQDREYRFCLQYWLGVRMSSLEATCPICFRECDAYGDHHVGCGGNNDRIARHDCLRETLFSVAQSAALAPRREVPSLIPGSCNRPADLYLPVWKCGRPAALDITVISPLQQLTLTKAATIQGSALSVAEERKRAAHADACAAAGISFSPMAVETIGGWGEEATETIRCIGRLQGLRLGLDPLETISHLFQRLSVSLWRGNAAMWAARASVVPPLLDGTA